jgi:hypothetical protein
MIRIIWISLETGELRTAMRFSREPHLDQSVEPGDGGILKIANDAIHDSAAYMTKKPDK